MTRHLKTYPKAAAVRATLTQDELDAKVAELSDYHTTVEVAKYAGDATPAALMAWARFTDALLDVYPDGNNTRDFTFTRPKTRKELEEAAVSDLQQDHYYHPDKYAYTDDEVTES